MIVAASLWTGLGIPVVLAVVGASVAALWPLLQSWFWIAFENRDLDERRWHLRRLLVDDDLGGQLSTKEAHHALERWDHFAAAGAKGA